MLTVLNQRCLDFGCGQSVAGDVDNVINTALDPVVSLEISSGTISSKLHTG